MSVTDDGLVDAALRRVLTDAGARSPIDAPDDLVARAARRLPATPPSVARIQERRRYAASMILRSSSLAAVVLLVALSGWGVIGSATTRPATDLTTVARLSSSVMSAELMAVAGGAVVRGTFAALVGLGLLLPCALLLVRWPGRTAATGLTLATRPLRATLVGLPLALVLSGLLLLVVPMGLTLIGLPVAALLLAVALVPQLVGLTALARAVGARLEGRRTPAAELDWPTAVVAALLALGLAVTAALAPLTALALLALLAAPGLGAAVLSRLGTRLEV
ncbi:MAG: hypothetical protein RLZZ387_5708 [Chloroflexota bacterium]